MAVRFVRMGADGGQEVYEVFSGERYIGMVCRSVRNKSWGATWNMILDEGDWRYCYPTRGEAVEALQRRMA